MTMERSRVVDWSDLPNELLELIADHTFSRLELVRFRSVCRSWRYSSSHKQFPNFPLKVPSLIRPKCHLSFIQPPPPKDFYLSLLPAIFFRIRPSSSCSSSSSKGRLIKLEELGLSKLRLVSPLSRLPIHHSYEKVNLLEFQVWRVFDAYSAMPQLKGQMPGAFKKVVVFPDATKTQKEKKTLVLTIGRDGKLRYWDGEGDAWIRINGQNNQYDDLIVHGGQLYVIDVYGIVSWIDSSLNVVQYAPPLGGRHGQKNFVESCGELYVVDRQLAGWLRMGQVVDSAFVHRYGIDRNHCSDVIISDNEGVQVCTVITKCDSKAIGFKVYKLDEEWGRWEEVKSLGDQAFIMATDCCFSVSARDFDGCLENAIYFTDQRDKNWSLGLNGHDLSVFKLDDGSISNFASAPSCFQLFTPSFF